MPRSWAVLRHHFDIHDQCGAFCLRKEESEDEKKASNKFYRDIVKDKPLYDALSEILSKYNSHERLQQVAHGYDTNPNESMNNLYAWIAPKNKCYSGSSSLTTRIGVAVCIQSSDFNSFFTTLFRRLGVVLTPGTEYWLKQQTKKGSRRTRWQSYQRRRRSE